MRPEASHPRRRLIRLLASAVALLLAFISSAAANPTIEDCFFDLVNVERAKLGRDDVPPLTDHPALKSVARAHSMKMASQETIFHNDELPEQIPPFVVAGENVGMGESCEAIHAAFMDSPGHRANILDPDYRQLGVGVTVRDGTIYVVEDFARLVQPKPPAPPKPPGKRPGAEPPDCT